MLASVQSGPIAIPNPQEMIRIINDPQIPQEVKNQTFASYIDFTNELRERDLRAIAQVFAHQMEEIRVLTEDLAQARRQLAEQTGNVNELRGRVRDLEKNEKDQRENFKKENDKAQDRLKKLERESKEIKDKFEDINKKSIEKKAKEDAQALVLRNGRIETISAKLYAECQKWNQQRGPTPPNWYFQLGLGFIHRSMDDYLSRRANYYFNVREQFLKIVQDQKIDPDNAEGMAYRCIKKTF